MNVTFPYFDNLVNGGNMYGINVFRHQFRKLSPLLNEQIVYINNITYQSRRVSKAVSWSLNTGDTQYNEWNQVLPVIEFINSTNRSSTYGIYLEGDKFSRSFKYEQTSIDLTGGGIGEKVKSTLFTIDQYQVDLN